MNNVLNVYAAYCRDNNLRLQSSSGGMFSIIAEQVLNQCGIIYGVKMSTDCYRAEYTRIDNLSDLSSLRGSKYLQATLGNTFFQVKKDLDNGKYVLFTGTGCYINGLKNFLKKEYNNLLCMDIICHGTPSPELWAKYAKYQESRFQSKLIYASFRNKDRHDWNGFEMKEIDQNNQEVYISRHIDPYFSLFVSNICLRPSCYNCVAKKIKKSDITVADFWGIDNVAPEMNDNLGISLVITRTEKGQNIFEDISEKIIQKKVTYEEGVHDNKSEYQSYPKPRNREKFFRDFQIMSFECLSHKYLRIPIWKKIKNSIYGKCITLLRKILIAIMIGL